MEHDELEKLSNENKTTMDKLELYHKSFQKVIQRTYGIPNTLYLDFNAIIWNTSHGKLTTITSISINGSSLSFMITSDLKFCITYNDNTQEGVFNIKKYSETEVYSIISSSLTHLPKKSLW